MKVLFNIINDNVDIVDLSRMTVTTMIILMIGLHEQVDDHGVEQVDYNVDETKHDYDDKDEDDDDNNATLTRLMTVAAAAAN